MLMGLLMDKNALRVAELLVAQLARQPQVVVGLADYSEFENLCDVLEVWGCRFERQPSQLQITLHGPAPVISNIAFVKSSERDAVA